MQSVGTLLIVLSAASLLVGLRFLRAPVSRANLTVHLCVRCALLVLALVGVANIYIPDNRIGPYVADSLIVTLPLLAMDLGITHWRRRNDARNRISHR
jgi:hypothetical protein